MRKAIILVAVCFVVFAAGLLLTPNSLLRVSAARPAQANDETPISAQNQRQVVNSSRKRGDLLGANLLPSLPLALFSQAGGASADEIWQDSKVTTSASRNSTLQTPTQRRCSHTAATASAYGIHRSGSDESCRDASADAGRNVCEVSY